jgi:hypothetical protein
VISRADTTYERVGGCSHNGSWGQRRQSLKDTPQLASFFMFSGSNNTAHESILSTPSAALTFSTL